MDEYKSESFSLLQLVLSLSSLSSPRIERIFRVGGYGSLAGRIALPAGHHRANSGILSKPNSLAQRSSRMLRAALTSRFQTFARQLPLAPRKTFLFSCKTTLPSFSLVRKRASFKQQRHWEQRLLVRYSSIGSTVVRFPSRDPKGVPEARHACSNLLK
jgi:hypothetical protein